MKKGPGSVYDHHDDLDVYSVSTLKQQSTINSDTVSRLMDNKIP